MNIYIQILYCCHVKALCDITHNIVKYNKALFDWGIILWDWIIIVPGPTKECLVVFFGMGLR